MRTLNFVAAGLVTLGMITSAHAAITPIAATGWNHDMVLNQPAPYNLSVDSTMDNGFGNIENWTWVQAGTYNVWNGSAGVATVLPGLVAGTHTSLTGNGSFTFQNFTGNNVIGIDGGSPTGSLTPTTPAKYGRIALYGASGGGATSANVTLTFSDASTSTYAIASGTGVGTDWFDFDGSPSVAYNVGARASNKSEEGYTILFAEQVDIISLYESVLVLTPADAAKTITNVGFTHTGGGLMTIFALSGEATPIPEPSTAALLGGGLFALAARRQRK